MLSLEPIGFVSSPFVQLADAPRQPHAAPGVRGRIELVRGMNLEDAVEDLDSWEYIWVLFWFHRAGGYRPKVLPPRSTGKRRGVLSTRSPHRPSPIGMSVVRLESVSGLTLEVANMDMIDGTPVLDIKPYVPWADIVPATAPGWLEPVDAPADPVPGYAVSWDALAEEQLAFLASLGEDDLGPAVEQRLGLGPQPHAYRRIRVIGDKRQLAHKDWRFLFRVEERAILVERIDSGHRPRDIHRDPALSIHQQFVARYGDPLRR